MRSALVCACLSIELLSQGSVCEYKIIVCLLFQAEDGIRELVRSRGLGDVYKRQEKI